MQIPTDLLPLGLLNLEHAVVKIEAWRPIRRIGMTMRYAKIALQSGSGRTAKRSIAHLQMQEWRRGWGSRCCSKSPPNFPIVRGRALRDARKLKKRLVGRPDSSNPCPCFPPKLAAASFVQRLMHQANRRRSFADCRRHALHVARAHIANRKHARQTGLENIRSAPQRPACAGEIFRRQIWSSLDEALLILNNTSFEPSRVRASSGHHENVPDVVSL